MCKTQIQLVCNRTVHLNSEIIRIQKVSLNSEILGNMF